MTSSPTSTTSTSPARVPLGQLAVLILIIVVVANTAFFFLSGSYAQSRTSSMSLNQAPVDLGAARMWFGIMSSTISVAALLAAFAPRIVGHVLAGATGVAAFVCGIGAGMRGLPGALSATLVVLGVLMPILTLRSLRGNRAAWSFLTVICGVLGVCLLFGAPKVRGIFDIGLWSAMIIPGMLAVAATSLTLIRRDYGTAPGEDDTAALA